MINNQHARKKAGAAYHDQGFLHAKDGVTCEIDVALRV